MPLTPASLPSVALLFLETGEVLEVPYDKLPRPKSGVAEPVYTERNFTRVVDGATPGRDGFVGLWNGQYVLATSKCNMVAVQAQTSAKSVFSRVRAAEDSCMGARAACRTLTGRTAAQNNTFSKAYPPASGWRYMLLWCVRHART